MSRCSGVSVDVIWQGAGLFPGSRRLFSNIRSGQRHYSSEAAKQYQKYRYDLVISDLGMGEGMNGWQLAEHVHALIPGVRFVLATGWGAQIDAAQAQERGVEAVIAKPYRLHDLRRVLTTVMSAVAQP